MQKIQNKQNAFTIIELLIVIVVIGILASLVLNVIGDSQKRARNTKVISLKEKYAKALVAYSIDNQAYPHNSPRCLGLNLADHEGSSLGDCIWVEGGGYVLSEDATFMATLEPYIGDTQGAITRSCSPSSCYSGPNAQYGATWTLDGVSDLAIIVYALEGYQLDCEPDSLGGAVWGTFTTANANSYYRTYSAEDSTLCVDALPQI